ncbi:MAG: hypothetical protein GEV07_13115 [Streptosporangiales bacterium]|nr:hypothetical protein [Streptosporangiales bacterium]
MYTDPFGSTDEDVVRRYSELATAFWSKAFSGLTAVAYRWHGSDFVNKLWYSVLTSHQDDKYVDGLRRLGIDGDPPAVAAAKYHYFTNIIGGLEMEYVEESKKKVWIRYLSPMWTYAGTALMAMPGNLRRTIFSSWHPRNGELMGCDRLGYVGTKFVMEGDPYDEGYFIEHDESLRPDQVMRFEVATRTPEFDPAVAPTLDPELWPEVRMLKARPKFSSRYSQATVDSLYRYLGTNITHDIVGDTMRMLAVQYLPDLRARTGAEGSSLADVATLHTELLKASRRPYEVVEQDDKRVRIAVNGRTPFGADYPDDLFQALFEFHAMATRLMNGHVRSSWTHDETGEHWTFEDTGSWLW